MTCGCILGGMPTVPLFYMIVYECSMNCLSGIARYAGCSVCLAVMDMDCSAIDMLQLVVSIG